MEVDEAIRSHKMALFGLSISCLISVGEEEDGEFSHYEKNFQTVLQWVSKELNYRPPIGRYQQIRIQYRLVGTKVLSEYLLYRHNLDLSSLI